MNLLNAIYDKGCQMRNTVLPTISNFVSKAAICKYGFIFDLNIEGDSFKCFELAELIKPEKIPIYFVSKIHNKDIFNALIAQNLQPAFVGEIDYTESNLFKVVCSYMVKVNVKSETFEANIKLRNVPECIDERFRAFSIYDRYVYFIGCVNLKNLDACTIDGLDLPETHLSIVGCVALKSIDALGPKIHYFSARDSNNLSFENSNLIFDIFDVSTDCIFYTDNKSLIAGLPNIMSIMKSNITINKEFRIVSRLRALNGKETLSVQAALEKLADKVGVSGLIVSFTNTLQTFKVVYTKP